MTQKTTSATIDQYFEDKFGALRKTVAALEKQLQDTQAELDAISGGYDPDAYMQRAALRSKLDGITNALSAARKDYQDLIEDSSDETYSQFGNLQSAQIAEQRANEAKINAEIKQHVQAIKTLMAQRQAFDNSKSSEYKALVEKHKSEIDTMGSATNAPNVPLAYFDYSVNRARDFANFESKLY